MKHLKNVTKKFQRSLLDSEKNVHPKYQNKLTFIEVFKLKLRTEFMK